MKWNAHEGLRFSAVNFNSGNAFNILEKANLRHLSTGMEPIWELVEYETGINKVYSFLQETCWIPYWLKALEQKQIWWGSGRFCADRWRQVSPPPCVAVGFGLLPAPILECLQTYWPQPTPDPKSESEWPMKRIFMGIPALDLVICLWESCR